MRVLCSLILVCVLLVSCAPEIARNCARAEAKISRAVALCPSLGEETTVIVRDTIMDVDTFFIPGTEVDTLAPVIVGDSIRIFDTVTRTEVVVRWMPSDTAGLWARVRLTVAPDTIRVVDTIVHETLVECPPAVRESSVWRWIRSGWRWLWILAIAGGVAAVWVFLRK